MRHQNASTEKLFFETQSTFIKWSRWWFHPLFLGKIEWNLTLRIFFWGGDGLVVQPPTSDLKLVLWGILGSLKTKRIGVYYSSYRPLKVPRRSPSILIPNPKRKTNSKIQKKSKKKPFFTPIPFRFFQLAIFFCWEKIRGPQTPGDPLGPKRKLRNLDKTAPRQELVSRCGRVFFLDKVCYVENKRCMDAWRFLSWFFWVFCWMYLLSWCEFLILFYIFICWLLLIVVWNSNNCKQYCNESFLLPCVFQAREGAFNKKWWGNILLQSWSY